MSANAISTDNLLNHRDRVSLEDFVPVVTYSVSGSNVTVVQASTFPSGIYLSKVHVRIHDKFGAEVRDTIVEEPGSGNADEVVISVASLDTSKPLDITATVLLDDGKTVADGAAYNIGASGTLGGWDKQTNA